MQLYLVRHAHAVDSQVDPLRPLSERGRQQARRMGELLRATTAFTPTWIWHSGLVRARETAEIIGALASPQAAIAALPGLRGDDDPALLVEQLTTFATGTALVGHDPHLSHLASLLVCGTKTPPRFNFRKGSVLALDRANGVWSVRWFVSPELLG
jgi:phosphohistidine phosphatase